MRRLLLQRGNEYETMEPLVSGVGNFAGGLCCPDSSGVAEIFRSSELRTLFCNNSGQWGMLWNSRGNPVFDWLISGNETKG